MRIGTNVFKLYIERYDNLAELAAAMGVSVSQVYRVKQGKRGINEKFIVGAIKAFPGRRRDELFHLEPDSTKATSVALRHEYICTKLRQG